METARNSETSLIQFKSIWEHCYVSYGRLIKKLRGLSPRASYTDRATAACRRSDCQLLRIKGHVVNVTDPYGRILNFLDRNRYFSIKQLLSCTHEAEWTLFQIRYFFFFPGSAGNRTRASGSVAKNSDH
jgi:hypothetical protein